MENERRKIRGESSEKWFILIPICTLWTASYHCILCISPLEDDMLKLFNLSNAEFSLFSAIIFAFAVCSSLLSPYIIHKINLYNAMLLSCVLCTFGQSIFIIGTVISNLLVMYTGRMLIGICYGIQNVVIYTVINIWFNNNKWLTFAINTVNTIYYIGVVTAYYFMIPLYRINNQIWVPYTLGIAFSLVSVIACIVMLSIEKQFCSDGETESASSKLDNNFSRIKHFGLMIWLILIVIIIGWSSSETFGALLTVPLMTAFNVSEWSIDILLSFNAIYALTIGQLWGWIISKYGYFSYYLMFSLILMTFSYGILCFYNDTWIISSELTAWIIMLFWVVGLQYFFGVCFTCLFMVCPLELTSMVNTVSSIGCMVGSMIQSYLFGLIADETDSFHWSILMVLSCLILGSLIAISVHFIDIIRDGSLHKESKSNKYDIINNKTPAKLNNYGSVNVNDVTSDYSN
eukprot:208809_1